MNDPMTAPTPTGLIPLDDAVDRLRAGGVVAFPTETVFGLGADALNPEAVERVYAMKGREKGKAMPVIVADLAMARRVTDGLTDRTRLLAEAFWPGPLTIVCPAKESIRGIVTAGGDTVALRTPGLPWLCELIRQVDRPLIAPSANRAGAEPAKAVDDLLRAFSRELTDGDLACCAPIGEIPIGQRPSTIIIPGTGPGDDRVIRQGPVTEADLLRVGVH